MSLTITATENIPALRLKGLNEGNILNHEPVEVVDMALERLQKAGVELIEWRAQLYRRMQVPIVVRDYSYLVSDDILDKATEILLDMGLPPTNTSKVLLRAEGDFQTKAHKYRITRATSPGFIQNLALYPISFSTLSWSEVEKQPLYNSPRCASILVPTPHALYASLIRMMLRYPRLCSTATLLHSDLSELVGYHLLNLQDGFVDPLDVGEWETKGVEESLALAAQKVRSWNADQVWRPGEEWIGDALYAVVEGPGDIEYLPWNSSSR
ncbi:hypothetical protein CPB83DRAFT_850459 [Crepidotus variabilis]|uniref:Uncharacterized protein n=1 Tax=Crepidotus variabilis TaxID=179855 RepID=A0A9P6EIX3_9AGAR|nr:hypothetical protein CPB83DRAFT_850459 [Crepidotus variabilis]